MLYSANVHLRFWGEALHTAVYCLNRTGTRTIPGMTPFQAWYGLKPVVSHMRVFGSDAYVLIPDAMRSKLQPKSTRGILMGYSTSSKAYRIWINATQKIQESRDVLFDETAVIRGVYAESKSQAPQRDQSPTDLPSSSATASLNGGKHNKVDHKSA